MSLKTCTECPTFILDEELGDRCWPCQRMEKYADDTMHDHKIRCPKCGHIEDTDNFDKFEGALYEDGEQDVWCGECDHEYTVSVMVTYTYTSPPRQDVFEEKKEN